MSVTDPEISRGWGFSTLLYGKYYGIIFNLKKH